MRSNPLSRGAVSVTLGHSRERPVAVKPLLAVIAVIVALSLPAVASAGLATITFRDVLLPGATAQRAERTLASTPGRFDLVGVRWHGSGNVHFSVRSTAGAWGPWLDAAVGGGRPAGRWLARGESEPRLAHRQPHLGRACERDPLSHHRQGARSPRVVRPEPRAEDPAPRRRLGRLAADRAAERVGRRRVDPARRALLRADDPVRERAPHGRHERLLAVAGGGDHARDRGLPRQVQRLERHRLQLSRRPLRHRLRGALRRHRQERDRRLCTRLQHRLARRRCDRHVRHVADPRCGRGVTREAARLAARPRPRRSGLVAHVRLGRERALQRRCSRPASGRLGAPRHGTDNVPREPPLREARHDRREDGGDRAAEALRAEGHRRRRRDGPVPGAGFLGAALEGAHHRRARPAAR